MKEIYQQTVEEKCRLEIERICCFQASLEVYRR